MSFELLRTLCGIPAPPGREDAFRTFLVEHLSPYADDVTTDAMGNVFFRRNGTGPNPRTIMLAAHMDEISFLVRHITKEGFLYVQPLGGFDPRVLDAQRVWIHGRERILGAFGTKPTHFTTPEERTKAVPLEDMFIDTGRSPEEVNALVRIGDPVTLERELVELGAFYTGKTLDDRVGVYVMAEAFKRYASSQDTIVAVATVQEEVGVRGAKVAAFGLEPDIGIALDITIAADIPGVEERNWCVRLGQGVHQDHGQLLDLRSTPCGILPPPCRRKQHLLPDGNSPTRWDRCRRHAAGPQWHSSLHYLDSLSLRTFCRGVRPSRRRRTEHRAGAVFLRALAPLHGVVQLGIRRCA